MAMSWQAQTYSDDANISMQTGQADCVCQAGGRGKPDAASNVLEVLMPPLLPLLEVGEEWCQQGGNWPEDDS